MDFKMECKFAVSCTPSRAVGNPRKMKSNGQILAKLHQSQGVSSGVSVDSSDAALSYATGSQ